MLLVLMLCCWRHTNALLNTSPLNYTLTAQLYEVLQVAARQMLLEEWQSASRTDQEAPSAKGMH